MDNEITTFFHCRKCLEELQASAAQVWSAFEVRPSPREYAQLEVGYTEVGVQVWCKRHEINVVNLDFDGQKVKKKVNQLKLFEGGLS